MSEPDEGRWHRVARIIGIIPEKNLGRRLKAKDAAVRVALAAIIQFVGTLVVLLPLSRKMREDGWQHDCFIVGLVFGVTGFLVLVATLIYVPVANYLSKDINVVATEWIIKILYTTNVVALSLAMARVGDPSGNVFGHLIALQLSGILLLEQQKESMTTPSSYTAMGYGLIAVFIWIAAVRFRESFVHLWFWSGDVKPCTSGCDDKLATKWLIPFEIVFTVFAYYFPKFFVKKKRRVSSGRQKPLRAPAAK
jgi:hypothetical protein